jgi:hypothetical protein
MTDPGPERESRMETLLPGVPVQAKIALLLGLAGGLFAAIVLSYTDADRQYVGLGIGIAVGIIAALVLSWRARGANHNPT